MNRKNLRKSLAIGLFLGSVIGSLPLLAHADLNGQSGTLNYLYPDTSTIFSTDSFTVPQTVITLTYGPDIVNTIDGSGISITFGNTPYSFGSGAFNGEQFVFPSVVLSSPVVTTDFNGINVTSDAHDIWINWQGLSPNSDSFVNLSVNNAAATPEPTTMLLFGTGLAGLAGFIRKKRS
jgi:hypothetical protein